MEETRLKEIVIKTLADDSTYEGFEYMLNRILETIKSRRVASSGGFFDQAATLIRNDEQEATIRTILSYIKDLRTQGKRGQNE